MKISFNRLKNYVNISITADELIKKLVNIGFDIESVEYQADKFKGFVIGKVLEWKKHPNANKLSLCKVDIGSETLSVVCGAPNVDAGQIICFAKVGAIIPNGEFELKKAKIRGEASEGMICSESELNLGDDHSGIMVLEDRVPIGRPFAEYLGEDDVIIDISITPNRGDLLSHIGVAREAGSILNEKIKIPDVKIDNSKNEIENYISVDILNPESCYRYCGRLVKNVKIKESPSWLKKYLTSVGLRPINNVVDISNFVMLECGQPLHTFDYDLIEGKKIIVKNAGDTKKFTTLDGKERKLRDNILLICDGVKPVALAGIMGGENSEIKENTKNVFIESAYFDPVVTRLSSKYLGLQTDSSYRFERGVDMSKVDWACNRTAQLIAELGEGEIVQGLIDNYMNRIGPRIIELDVNYVNKIIGKEFTSDEIIKLLGTIEIKYVSAVNNKIIFEVPFARYDDIIRDIDLIEEITRLYGYEKIPGLEYDRIFLESKNFDDDEFNFINKLRDFLVGRGFKEILTNSLVSDKEASKFNDNLIYLVNPSTQDMNVLRNNLFIGLLQTVRNNFNFKASSLKLFETGDIFEYTENEKTLIPKILERKCLCLTFAGNYDMISVNQSIRAFDLFDLKGEVKALLEKLNIDNYKLNYYNYDSFYDYKIEVTSGNNIFGTVYLFNKKILNEFNIENPVLCCELFIKDLMDLSSSKKIYSEVSKFPPVLRDTSLVIPKDIKVDLITEEVKKIAGKLLKNINLYDVYELKEKPDFISYTFSLEFSSDEKTLTDEEINKIQDKIINNLNKKFFAELRT